MKKKLFKIAIFAMMTFLLSNVNAQVTTAQTFNGADSANNSNFGNGANWTGGARTTGAATLTASPVVDANYAVASLSSSGANEVTASGVNTLTINGSTNPVLNANSNNAFNINCKIDIATAATQRIDVKNDASAKLVFGTTSSLKLSQSVQLRNFSPNIVEFRGNLEGSGTLTLSTTTTGTGVEFYNTANNATYTGTMLVFASSQFITSNITSPNLFLGSTGIFSFNSGSGLLTLNGANTMEGKLSRVSALNGGTAVVNFNANQNNMGLLSLGGVASGVILQFNIASGVTNLTFASTDASWATAKLDIIGFKDDVLNIGGTPLTTAQLDAITLNSIAQTSGYFSQRANGAIVKTSTLGTANTWTGGTNTVWTNASNWSAGVPDLNSDVTIGTGTFQPTIASTVNIKSLTINSGATLTVNTGSNLTVAGAIANSGTMTLANNSNLIQGGTTNSNTGNITVNRNGNSLKRLDFTIWSSPVSGTQTLAQFSPLTSQSPNRFYTYDTANNQYNNTNTPTTDVFAKASGYLIRMPNTDPTTNYDAGTATLMYPGVFIGVPNNGTITKAVTLTGNGYNMVGNPYPSTIDANAFLSANINIASALYFWRKTNGAGGTAYATYNSVGPVATGSGLTGTGSEAPNGIIQVGQGFFVKATSGTEVTFTNAMRVANIANQFFKSKQVNKDRVWLNLTNTSGAFSQTLVGYLDGASQGVDALDAKYINDSPIALTSNINDEEYTIQARPAFDATDVVALNFKTDVAGDYTIALDHFDGLFATGQDVYLVDNKTGTETDLKAAAYTFTVTEGTDNARFSLKYQKTLKVDDQVFNDNSITVYKNNGTLSVNSGVSAIKSIKVYDIQGRVIATQTNVNANTAIIKNVNATQQVLIVKVTSEDNKVITKKVVN